MTVKTTSKETMFYEYNIALLLERLNNLCA